MAAAGGGGAGGASSAVRAAAENRDGFIVSREESEKEALRQSMAELEHQLLGPFPADPYVFQQRCESIRRAVWETPGMLQRLLGREAEARSGHRAGAKQGQQQQLQQQQVGGAGGEEGAGVPQQFVLMGLERLCTVSAHKWADSAFRGGPDAAGEDSAGAGDGKGDAGMAADAVALRGTKSNSSSASSSSATSGSGVGAAASAATSSSSSSSSSGPSPQTLERCAVIRTALETLEAITFEKPSKKRARATAKLTEEGRGNGNALLVVVLRQYAAAHFRIAIYCCRAIANAAAEPTNRDLLGELGACEGIVRDAITVHNTSADVAELGCVAISSLARECTANRKRFSDAGACEAIVIHAFLPHGRVYERTALAACNAIISLIAGYPKIPENCDRLGVAGACEAVVNHLLLPHANSTPTMAATAAWAIAELTYDHWGNRDRFAALRTCVALVNLAINPHAERHISVCEKVCKAITHMCTDHAENQKQAVESGTCKAVVERILKPHARTSEQIAANVVHVIECIAWRNAASRAVFISTYTLRHLVSDVLQPHGRKQPTLDRVACRAMIGILRDNLDARDQCPDACSAVVKHALVPYGQTSEVAMNGCWLVARLAENNPAYKARLGQARACVAVVENALRPHGYTCPSVAYVASAAIGHLALGNTDNARALRAQGACEALLDCAIRPHAARFHSVSAMASWAMLCIVANDPDAPQHCADLAVPKTLLQHAILDRNSKKTHAADKHGGVGEGDDASTMGSRSRSEMMRLRGRVDMDDIDEDEDDDYADDALGDPRGRSGGRIGRHGRPYQQDDPNIKYTSENSVVQDYSYGSQVPLSVSEKIPAGAVAWLSLLLPRSVVPMKRVTYATG